MRHKLIQKMNDHHSYETVRVELLPDNDQEKEWIKNLSEDVKNYLVLNL